VSVPPDGSARLRRALRESQAALAVRLSRLREANERDVHQCRVDCRRLRALLRSYKSFLSAEQVPRFRAALKRVADLLAEIRELDVLAAQPPLRSGPCDRELATARQQAVKRLARRLQSPSNRAAVDDVGCAVVRTARRRYRCHKKNCDRRCICRL
jgi:CHAD domain-containing protein